MAPPLIRRRRADGIVEIRPRRARDLVASPDAAVLLGLLALFLLFAAALVATLVASPILVGVAIAFVLATACADALARAREPVRAPSPSPSPSPTSPRRAA
jgi:hypothetical protein